MPDNDEDAWIFVADDSSSAGRKLKPQLIGSFSGSNLQAGSCLPVNGVSPKAFEFNPHECNRDLIPEAFLCPITRDIMTSPVVAAGRFFILLLYVSFIYYFLLKMDLVMN